MANTNAHCSQILGKIQEHMKKNMEDPPTPLQQKLDEFGEQLSKVCHGKGFMRTTVTKM